MVEGTACTDMPNRFLLGYNNSRFDGIIEVDMEEFLKHYRMRIEALSPIYIGSGVKLGKKEYIYMPWNHEVIIPDMQKMFLAVQKKGLIKEFTDFMMNAGQNGKTLSQWLKEHRFGSEDYEAWRLYKMDAGEAFLNPKASPKEIDAFIKDAYGCPYVPGSSIKGMLRTALIAWELHKNPDKYCDIKEEVKSASERKANRSQYLMPEIKKLEQRVLYVLSRDEENGKSAVNDCLSGLYVGDSEPIGLGQLTLSQKIDYTVDGTEKPISLLRETLIPGTKIDFDITIDTTILKQYDIDDILEALEYFKDVCNQYFYSRFKRTIKDSNAVLIGGGCGFLSKTVIYSLCTSDGVKVVDNIFKNTLNDKIYKKHKHYKNLQLHLAPHVCKCTKYKGELYDMGIGCISIQNS